MDWIQHDLGTWGYLSTQSFLDNLYWPIKRMYLKLLDIKAKLDEPPPEMVYEDSDSNVTQDPGLGHGSPRDHEMTDATRSSDHDVNQNQPLDPDMTAYRFDPFSRNVKVDSLIENQSVLETLKKIISDSLTQQMEAQYFTTEWFVDSSNKASVWQKELWLVTVRDNEEGFSSSGWELSLYRQTQLISLLHDIATDEMNQVLAASGTSSRRTIP